MHPIIERLKERKLVQWALAYLAGAVALYSALDAFAEPWGVGDSSLRGVQIALAVGFFVTVTFAWYHGERGEQRVTRSEGIVLAVIVVVGAAALLGVRSGDVNSDPDAALLPSQPSPARRVLVIPPENASSVEDLVAWGVLAADAMNRAITRHTELDVIAASEARRVFQGEAPGRPEALVTSLSVVGASYALSSSSVLLGETIRLTIEVLDGADGSVLRTLPPVSFPRDSLELGIRLVEEAVGVAAISLESYDGWPLRLLTLSRTTEAARLVGQARQAMCTMRQEDAASLAQRAQVLEPDWPEPYLILRPVLFNLGRDSVWESEYEESMLALLPRMTDFERYSWDFMEGATTEDRLRGAVGGFRLTEGKSSFNQGYAVAFRALQLNYLELAREGMDTIGDADGPCGVSWRYRWVVDGQLYHLMGDFESELMTLRDGQERFPTEFMLVRDEIGALAALDHLDDLAERLDRLEALPTPPDSVWNALHDVALELVVHGHPAASVQALDRLLDWGQTHALSALRRGHALYDAGRYADAEPLLVAALEEARTGAALGLLAMTLDQLGRSREADELVRQLESGEDVVFYGDHVPEEFPASRWPTIVAASRGEHDRAVSLLRRAFEQGLRYYDLNQMQIHIRPELMALRDHPGYRELMAPRPYSDVLGR